MSKLAKEIFDEISDRFDLFEHERDEVEAIVAVKLESVRKALDQWDKLTEQEDWFLDIDALGHAMEDTADVLARTR